MMTLETAAAYADTVSEEAKRTVTTLEPHVKLKEVQTAGARKKQQAAAVNSASSVAQGQAHSHAQHEHQGHTHGHSQGEAHGHSHTHGSDDAHNHDHAQDEAHGHTHSHEHGEGDTRKILLRLGAGGILAAAGMFLPVSGFPELLIFLAAYFIVGGEVVWSAARNIVRGQVFDENFLMALATIGAFAIGEYPEGVAVMLFYQVGELFQGLAVNRSRRSITALMDIRPEFAFLKEGRS